MYVPPPHWMFTLGIPFAYSAKNWQTDRQTDRHKLSCTMNAFFYFNSFPLETQRSLNDDFCNVTYESYLIMYVLNKCANVNLNNWLEPFVQIFVNSIVKKIMLSYIGKYLSFNFFVNDWSKIKFLKRIYQIEEIQIKQKFCIKHIKSRK